MSPPPFLVFLHIEKTAGTTLYGALRRALSGYQRIERIADDANPSFDGHLPGNYVQKVLEEFPSLNGIGGHPLRAWSDYSGCLRQPFFFTLLRNPVDRFLSHFFHQRERKGFPWTLKEYLRDGRFSNVMCRRLCGKEDANEAKRIVQKFGIQIGLAENFDISFQRLLVSLRDFGLPVLIPPAYRSRNMRKGLADAHEKVEQDRWGEEIRYANAEDQVLYDWAVEMQPTALPPMLQPASELACLGRRIGNKVTRLRFRPWEARNRKALGGIA